MNENQKEKNIENAAIAGASFETVQRFGAANKEHLVAYSGNDYENGVKLQKSLKSIHDQGTNPEYEFQIRQQKAGFAAEVKETARTNAENIIKKDPNRKPRYDDLKGESANNPLYDHVELDGNGNVIDGSKSQMKFVGASKDDPKGTGNAERALKKLQSKKFEKYLENDVKIDVPSDEYKKMIELAEKEIERLQKQLQNQKQNGNTEAAKQLEKQIESLKKIKKNLRPCKVSRKDSTFAVDHPELSTAVDMVKVSHRAGMEAAKFGGVIGGSVSIVKNMVAVCKGEEDPNDAMLEVAKDTASAVAVGYGTGFAGSTVKAFMQNSKSELMRTVSKTNVPGTIVAVTVAATKTLTRYFEGEIDGVECLEELGEQGTGMIASAMFAVVGQTVIPIPIVGGLIGGMVGYALSSATYGILMNSLKDAKLAKEYRIKVEQACDEHIKLLRQYRAEIENIINEYLLETTDIFRDSYNEIKMALAIGDVDMVIESANTITEQFGGEVRFSNRQEFDSMMLSGETFKL